MKKRFANEQIIGFLKQTESGIAIKDPCRRHGFSDAMFYTGLGHGTDGAVCRFISEQSSRYRRQPKFAVED